jgi:hypothetical protein
MRLESSTRDSVGLWLNDLGYWVDYRGSPLGPASVSFRLLPFVPRTRDRYYGRRRRVQLWVRNVDLGALNRNVLSYFLSCGSVLLQDHQGHPILIKSALKLFERSWSACCRLCPFIWNLKEAASPWASKRRGSSSFAQGLNTLRFAWASWMRCSAPGGQCVMTVSLCFRFVVWPWGTCSLLT